MTNRNNHDPRSSDSEGKTRSVGPLDEDATQRTASRDESSLLDGSYLPDSVPSNRFEILDLLGEGGMGRVFKALDTQLKRPVALKFLRSEESGLTRQLLQEARSQARIDHEYVCKIYEVGRLNGRLFIAMRYVQGSTLREARASMSLEQKVDVMRKVCEGVHEAHRQGLIHRDLKPSNILVEQGEDGTWKPQVMDFGLAREMSNAGMTTTGTVLGTPRYMAPEQALGHVDRLDRRTDVYALGVTLYEMLTGALPFEGTATEVLLKVIHDEPRPLRKVDAAIPMDLETIVMKCIEKEPQRRYDSARAVADELLRYLEGEPLAVRRSSLIYRLLKRARKHRALVAVSAVALIGLGTISGLALQSAWEAAEQARLTQVFGQKVQKVENLLRLGYLLPLHDVQREEMQVRRLLGEIQGDLERVGKPGQGPGQYALGRGRLALREPDSARRHFEAALDAGFRIPEVASGLGQALGAMYRRELAEVERISNAELREERRRRAELKLRDPALASLRSAGNQSAILDPEYAEGLMAFYEKRYDAALEHATAAVQAVPWLYEAELLQGDVHTELGRNQQQAGNLAAAAVSLEAAGAAYIRAAAIARSDPAVFEGDCRRWAYTADLFGYTGKPQEAPRMQAIAACDFALMADPRSVQARLLKSGVYLNQAEQEFRTGVDPSAALESARTLASQVLEHNRREVRAWDLQGTAFRMLGHFEESRGRDPRPALQQAADSFTKALKIEPDSFVLNNSAGIVFGILSGHEQSHGMDPRNSLQQALTYLQKAIELAPNLPKLHSNVGIAWEIQAGFEWDAQIDPRPSLENAQKSFREAMRLAPDWMSAYDGLTSSLVLRATIEMSLGADPTRTLTQAQQIAQQSVERLPGQAIAYRRQSQVAQAQAEWDQLSGRDPRPAALKSIQFAQQALQTNAEFFEAFLDIGRANETLAEYGLDQGKNVTAELQQASAALQSAARLNDHPAGWRLLGRLKTLEGRQLLAQGRDPWPTWAEARATLEKARSLKGDAELEVLFAELERRQAEAALAQKKEALPHLTNLRKSLDIVRSALPKLPELRELDRSLTALERQAGVQPPR